SPVMDAVIERLDADAVANKPEAPDPRIPKCEGEHAAEFLQAFNAPFLKGVKDDLRVGVVCFPVVTSHLFQLTPDFRVVVNLAIEDDPDRTVGIAHRLRGRGRQVDDGETAMR